MMNLPALVEAQSPVGGHGWLANHSMILLNHCLRAGAQEEIKVKHTAKDPDTAQHSTGQRVLGVLNTSSVETGRVTAMAEGFAGCAAAAMCCLLNEISVTLVASGQQDTGSSAHL